jgi:hypothetical protein
VSADVAVNVPAAILFVVIVLAILFVIVVALTRERPPPPKGRARARFKVGVYFERDRHAEELEPWDVEDTLELPPRA